MATRTIRPPLPQKAKNELDVLRECIAQLDSLSGDQCDRLLEFLRSYFQGRSSRYGE